MVFSHDGILFGNTSRGNEVQVQATVRMNLEKLVLMKEVNHKKTGIIYDLLHMKRPE